jgi:hypothetical protein
MSPESLQVLFRCERFVSQFPHGMTVRACLRRQYEKRVLRDSRGKVVDATLERPFCALECGMGARHTADARAAGVDLGTCGTCGAGLIGESCTTCEEAVAAREVRRAPSPRRPEVSVRLWTGEVPDVPIAPLPAARPGLAPADAVAALERVRTAVLIHSGPAPAAATRPARPADPPPQETTMACSDCGSKTIHRANCPKKGAGPKPPPKPAGARAARPLVLARVGRRIAGSDLDGKTIAELRKLIEGALAAIRRKVERAELEASEGRAALGLVDEEKAA